MAQALTSIREDFSGWYNDRISGATVNDGGAKRTAPANGLRGTRGCLRGLTLKRPGSPRVVTRQATGGVAHLGAGEGAEKVAGTYFSISHQNRFLGPGLVPPAFVPRSSR